MVESRTGLGFDDDLFDSRFLVCSARSSVWTVVLSCLWVWWWLLFLVGCLLFWFWVFDFVFGCFLVGLGVFWWV